MVKKNEKITFSFNSLFPLPSGYPLPTSRETWTKSKGNSEEVSGTPTAPVDSRLIVQPREIRIVLNGGRKQLRVLGALPILQNPHWDRNVKKKVVLWNDAMVDISLVRKSRLIWKRNPGESIPVHDSNPLFFDGSKKDFAIGSLPYFGVFCFL